jgi:hypothetical protein
VPPGPGSIGQRAADDIRDAIGAETERSPGYGQVFRSLDEMMSTELDAVSGAVSTLLEKRFTAVMDDPALPTLLDEYLANLNASIVGRIEVVAEYHRD